MELECDSCVGPVGRGILLAMPVAAMKAFKSFNGAPTVFTVPLIESAGWIKDPQNTLKTWSKPSQCDMIQVLSRLSAIRILGDWTPWYETVALDNVLVKNTKGKSKAYSSIVPLLSYLSKLKLFFFSCRA